MNTSTQQLTNEQKNIIDGHLLGDGNISKPNGINGNSRFSVERKIEDKDYLLWTVKHLENFIYFPGIIEREKTLKNSDTIYKSVQAATKHANIFTEQYHRWYPEGKKIVPKDLVLSPLTIAVWFCDDGYFNCSSRLKLQFATNCFGYDDVIFLKSQLEIIYNDIFYLYNQRDSQFLIEAHSKDLITKVANSIIDLFPDLFRKYHKLSTFIDNSKQNYPIKYKYEDINFLEKNIYFYPPCRFCGGKNIRKCGIDKNKIKFLCKDCNKRYMREEDYSINNKCKKEKHLPQCIYCKSKNTTKNSISHDNKQVYKCLDCNKHYLKLTDYKNKPIIFTQRPNCINCGSNQVWKSGMNKNGEQRYQCKICNKKYI